MYDLLIQNGLVYANGWFHKLNVCVKGEKIAFSPNCDTRPEARTIDATETCFPGFSDLMLISEIQASHTRGFLGNLRRRQQWYTMVVPSQYQARSSCTNIYGAGQWQKGNRI